MHQLTISFKVNLPTIEAFRLISKLDFVPVDEIGERSGPFVYAHVVSNGGVVYLGKNEANLGPVAGRPKQYAKWVAGYRKDVIKRRRADPMDDITNGDLDLLRWSPIVRFSSRHSPVVHIASVLGTGDSARVWEARLQALSGVLTGNESLIGGSGWEANGWTNRGRG